MASQGPYWYKKDLKLGQQMQVFKGVQDLAGRLGGGYASSVVTIGNFDGVHLGHQRLVQALVMESRIMNVPSVVYTFYPHPVRVLYPEIQTFRLFDLRDQEEQFEKAGIDAMVIENFTADFAKVTALKFLEDYIQRFLKPKTLVVGHDFSFGANRHGDLHFLENFCSSHNIKLVIIPPFQLDSKVVSSSKIREELKNGEVANVAKLLGRPFYLRGHVEKGYQRGRTIGVPTANIHPDVEFIPRQGVYVTQTKVAGIMHPSITNIGINPTFAESKKNSIKIESHLFNFDAQIYGEEVEVYLLKFLRDEQKFSGIDQLKIQIQKDLLSAKDYFENH